MEEPSSQSDNKLCLLACAATRGVACAPGSRAPLTVVGAAEYATGVCGGGAVACTTAAGAAAIRAEALGWPCMLMFVEPNPDIGGAAEATGTTAPAVGAPYADAWGIPREKSLVAGPGGRVYVAVDAPVGSWKETCGCGAESTCVGALAADA
jgi:hypothetical protein